MMIILAKSRHATIDVLRGISIIMIIYLHFMMAWADKNWEIYVQVSWSILDFFGAPMFVFLSCLVKMLSIKSGKDSKMQTFKRASFLMMLGTFVWMNECFSSQKIVIPCNLLFFMGVLQIVMPILMKRTTASLLMFVSTIFITFFPLSILWQAKTFYTVFMDTGMNPYFTWMMIPLLVTIIFKNVDAFNNLKGKELKKIAGSGIILILIAVATSILFAKQYRWYLIDYALFDFLARGYPQYIFIMLGIDLILFSVIASFESRIKTRMVKIQNFGRLSLTGYVLSGIGFIIPIKLFFIPFHVIFPLIVMILVHAMFFVSTRCKDKFTMEYFMSLHSRLMTIAVQKIKRTRSSQETKPAIVFKA